LSSADTDVAAQAEAEPDAPRDERRDALVAEFSAELGEALVGSHIRVGDDTWLRVDRAAWRDALGFAHRSTFTFFDFVAGIDWLPSPFGRDMDAQEDHEVNGTEAKEPPAMTTGYAGGDTRFQVFARVYSIERQLGVTIKADLPDDDLRIDSLVSTYAGANWHERETAEMYGIEFVGHPNPQRLYLPLGFEGHPLRKDFPLLARRVKPWPGIADVEPMPGGDDDEEGGE
jgi:NADH-quinone oxidoreductase subunit C